MNRKSLEELLERAETWPKEAQEAAFDALSAIEEDIYGVSDIVEDILRSRDDCRRGGRTS
jgi:hypothetical protein